MNLANCNIFTFRCSATFTDQLSTEYYQNNYKSHCCNKLDKTIISWSNAYTSWYFDELSTKSLGISLGRLYCTICGNQDGNGLRSECIFNIMIRRKLNWLTSISLFLHDRFKGICTTIFYPALVVLHFLTLQDKHNMKIRIKHICTSREIGSSVVHTKLYIIIWQVIFKHVS